MILEVFVFNMSRRSISELSKKPSVKRGPRINNFKVLTKMEIGKVMNMERILKKHLCVGFLFNGVMNDEREERTKIFKSVRANNRRTRTKLRKCGLGIHYNSKKDFLRKLSYMNLNYKTIMDNKKRVESKMSIKNLIN